MFYDKYFVSLTDHMKVAVVTVDIVEVCCGYIVFVEEGTNVFNKIYEASLFFLSNVEMM